MTARAEAAGLRAELQRMLAETETQARTREQRAFDEIAGEHKHSIVLFGAGGFGRRALAGLRGHGIEPLAFADNNQALWGREVNGVPVLSPVDAANTYGNRAAFVITIWHGLGVDRMADRENQLRKLGCRTVLPFGQLFWKYPGGVLPHYGADLPHCVLEEAQDALATYDLWEDDASRREYVSQIRWRLFLDFNGLRGPVEHPIYFPKDLCPLRDDEVFIDCGAFNGDTARLFLRECGMQFKRLFAFEPDPKNFEDLRAEIAQYPEHVRTRIELRRAATGKETGRVHFAAEGAASSHMGSGTLEVDCVAVDEALGEVAPTYIKMDIEGAELNALAGGAGLIRKHAPVLAICCYHRQNDLWRIPMFIRSLNPEYKFFLRPHDLEMWDLVCYAVPPVRYAAGGAAA